MLQWFRVRGSWSTASDRTGTAIAQAPAQLTHPRRTPLSARSARTGTPPRAGRSAGRAHSHTDRDRAATPACHPRHSTPPPCEERDGKPPHRHAIVHLRLQTHGQHHRPRRPSIVSQSHVRRGNARSILFSCKIKRRGIFILNISAVCIGKSCHSVYECHS